MSLVQGLFSSLLATTQRPPILEIEIRTGCRHLLQFDIERSRVVSVADQTMPMQPSPSFSLMR